MFSILAIGINGFEQNDKIETEYGVYYVSKDNGGAPQKIDDYTDLSFLAAANRKELLNKIKELYIDLPMIDGEIDYNFMETYIRAVEKKAIQNVVKWKNLEITKTKQAVNASK